MAYNEQKCTDVWKLYEQGKLYNQSLVPNQYDLVNTNIEFFIGNQWKGLAATSAMAALPKPVFNIIKRICSLFVASLTSSSTKVSFEPLANAAAEPDETVEEAQTAADMANSEIENLFEKFKMDFRIRDALFDGVQTGDYCAHFYFDPTARPYGGAYADYRGEIVMELVDGINVMFGNPNTSDVEKQPYIIVIGRDTVENLKEEYKQHHKGASDLVTEDQIRADRDNHWQAGSGGKTELIGDDDKTGKAIFMYYYTKRTVQEKVFDEMGNPVMEKVLDEAGHPVIKKTKKGFPMLDIDGNPIYEEKQAVQYKTTVHVSKHTKFVDIFDEVDTGLTYYPIAWGNWEKQKNIYHGRALVTGIIPNQIYINSMFALIMRHQQMLGFPKTLYDANVIGQWNNAVGQAIAVYDLPPDKRMSDLHSVIQPADMSTQIMSCIERAMQYTKECLGATDAQLGNIRPENTSAIIALQSSSQVPLENPQANKYEWVEDIGRILLDMMGTYYGERPVVRHVQNTQQIVDPATGMPSSMVNNSKVIEMYDFSKLKHLWLNVRADVGASTYWSRIAIVQTLDNLKQAGVLDVLDYLERMPDEYIPKKDELIAKLRKQLEAQQQQPQLDPNSPDNPIADVAGMPAGMQEMYSELGTPVKKALATQSKLNMV